MKTRGLKILLSFLLPTLALAGEISPLVDILDQKSPDQPLGVWVYFKDKGFSSEALPSALASAIANQDLALTDRALARRAKVYGQHSLTDARDLPIFPAYLSDAQATGAISRRVSRWFNAASFNATREQIQALAQLDCVERIEPIARFRRSVPGPFQDELPEDESDKGAASVSDYSLDYGGSIWAAELINVPPVHDMGLSGDGVVVAVLDAGFMLDHEAFTDTPILAQWDFVHNDDNVTFEPGDHEWQDHHGGQVLSTIMGFTNGKLVGTAYGASAILAMTEDTADETIIEEDNWIAAVEWVESLGADIVTSSLGYYYWYKYSDLDGNTALITRAADMAVERGMAVFTSAGNERNNAEWPHLTAPADGDSVMAVGAVDAYGTIASFSSPGPTYDGRIKPDLCAMGVGTHVASYYGYDAYGGANGTSFAAPQVAGIAALMLERIPQLTPMQIREALHQSSNQSGNPNNDYGWGILDSAAAIAYWGATISHDPLTDTEDINGPYLVEATITDRVALDAGQLWLHWRLDEGPWQQVALNQGSADTFSGWIPGTTMGGTVEYYLQAGDVNGYIIDAPHRGALNPWAFQVGQDISAPELYHPTLTDQIPSQWPPVVRVEAVDNQSVAMVEISFTVNGGMEQGPFSLAQSGTNWALNFPLDATEISAGDVLHYWVQAQDSAAVPNTASSGPHEVRIVESLGRVLIIDDLEGQTAQNEDKAVDNLANTFEGWLMEAGYEVNLTSSGMLTGTMLDWADVAFLTSGNNLYPVGDANMRDYLIAFAESGGHILVEGGETAAASFFENQYLEFAQSVLHASEFQGDIIGPLIQANQQGQHAFLNRPNDLPNIVSQDMSPAPYDYASSDIVLPDSESMAVYTSIYNTSLGGVILHDDNTGLEGGQLVYLTVDLGYMPEILAKPLLENCLTYLAGRESPGEAALAGTVALSGSSSAEGVVVSVNNDHSVTTGPDGVYLLDGLHGATYTLTASKEGYGSASLTVELGAQEMLGGLDMTLAPVQNLTLTDEVEQAIPDNNSAGMSRTLEVATPGLVQSITVDMDLEHGSIGQLEVTLTNPDGISVTLHNNSGGISDDLIGNWPTTLLLDGPGSLDDFLNTSALGTWTMHVADTGWGALGTWHSWGLNLGVAMQPSPVEDPIPWVTRVVGNYPNPFNPRTTVQFELKKAGRVELAIFNIQGRRVKSFATESWAAGPHELVWDGTNDRGQPSSSGMYFFRMKTQGNAQVCKMTLVR